MAKKRRTKKSKARRKKAKINTGGRLAPAKCKTAFKSCMRSTSLEKKAGKSVKTLNVGKFAADCLKKFNDCRL